jgi:hypothetical protein
MLPSIFTGILLCFFLITSAQANFEDIPNYENSLDWETSSNPSQNPLDHHIAWGASKSDWTNTVRSIVRARFSDFLKARDASYFCPGFSKASRAEQENCFIAIVAAIAKFECNFRPDLSFREPNGNLSVGLLMLSAGECSNAPTAEKLKNPQQNLICGTNKMAHLIARDKAISGTPGSYGAAAYWSTLRNPYRSGKYKLGKKGLIQQITRNYRGSAFYDFHSLDYDSAEVDFSP